ncbi:MULTISPECIES: hypothetical protein [Pseudomonas]|nr:MULTISPECIES: hypothetical protein [Pseudomonas]KTB67388.1 hypothetical protein AO063_22040 [Pseudomonas fluorescens ICMP 11288]
MAIVWTTEPLQQSKATAAVVIKNPHEVKNAFTINTELKAAETLKLDSQKEISQLKDFLKNYDMASISTDELRKVGRRLYDSGIISGQAFGMFIGGDLANDEKGLPTNTHVKFNAIALFNERLESYDEFLKDNPKLATQDNLAWRQGMVAANQAISALTYFVNSSHNHLAIDERA